MGPKNSKFNKINDQFPTKGVYIKEIYQANSLEDIIGKYNSLNNPCITFREFKHAISCKIYLYPLKNLIKKRVDITKSYLVRWKRVGYLSNFREWINYPYNIQFIGPDQNLYKIIP